MTAVQAEDGVDAKSPLIEPWGYPLDALDKSVKPGDDFFRYANGAWLDRTEIPADRTGTGFSVDMTDRNEERIAAIIAGLSKTRVKKGSNEQKIRDLYNGYMDEARIEKLGLKPVEKNLARIAALASPLEVARAMADPSLGLDGPFAAGVGVDSKQPTRYVVYLWHSGLHLPDKTYFERDDDRIVSIRAAFVKHIETMLELAGVENARAKAQGVFDLEVKIAALHWDLADRRDADRTYNAMSLDALESFAPGFPWRDYLAAAGFAAAEKVVVQENSAFPSLAILFAETPVETWRDYLAFSLLTAHARYLPQAFDDEAFAFFGQTLSGQSEQRTREKRGIAIVNQRLDQAVGKIYIERYFPEESKQRMIELFENIRDALKIRIENLSWMTPATKQAALEKLAKMTAKIAYPEKWRDYSDLEIRPGDLIGNIQRARAEEAARDAQRLGEPVDKREWFTGPQTVNAFYSSERNEAFIPAGYIQSPLFDPYADPAINYGAIGSIIGHEIGHGFDDQGSKSDGDGFLRDWWTEKDRVAFDALGDRFAAQFDKYEYLPGMFVNGRATLGENIGDLAGVVVAYQAYMLSLDGEEPPVLDGFTGAQRVFLGRAQARRFKRTEESDRRILLSDVHSPMSLRVNGIVRNIDEWYEAFAVRPGDRMYLPPEERVKIW
ncbi:MAG: M13 family metallopeptidase [Pseudomonadota bacterium]|nr:M13 family metallopeptidase [Pseudomonadota bacterium]